MALNLTPYKWNWSTCTAGDTYPAARWTETNSDYDNALSRVRCTIRDVDRNIFATLDSSTSGIVINTATAGVYTIKLEWFDSTNVNFTESSGTWEIL